MARTRGSKNKTAPASVEEKIKAVEAEISRLQDELKTKKAERKKLLAQQDEENQQKILAAVEKSGKSFDEVMALLKGNAE